MSFKLLALSHSFCKTSQRQIANGYKCADNKKIQIECFLHQIPKSSVTPPVYKDDLILSTQKKPSACRGVIYRPASILNNPETNTYLEALAFPFITVAGIINICKTNYITSAEAQACNV